MMWCESFQSSFQPPWFLYSWISRRVTWHAGEVLRGARDGFAVGFGDIHQHAIHVENQNRLAHGFQISSSAASRRRVCSRVPTVMRTQPGAS